MCLASTDPGGPRRCSADARTAYLRATVHVDDLHALQEGLDHAAAAGLLEAYTAATHLDTPARDAFLAALTPDQVDTLAEQLNDHVRPAVDDAFATTAAPQLVAETRAVTKQPAVEAAVRTHAGSTETRSVIPLGDGLALYRPRPGAYALALHDGQAYAPIAATTNASRALQLAARVPVLDPLPPPPQTGGVDDLAEQAYRANRETALQLAAAAAHNRLPDRDAQTTFLQERDTASRAEVVDAAAATPLRAEVLDATARHRHREQLAAAEQAAEKARTAAAAAGDPTATQMAAAAQAHHRALGQPTRGGAYIPHFNHAPVSIPAEQQQALAHSGFRTYGIESAADYTVIARRGGDLKQWGINSTYGTLAAGSIKSLTATHRRFVNDILTEPERQALRTYTDGKHFNTGAYLDINAALTGRDTDPAPSTVTTCAHLRSAFDKFARHNTSTKPTVLARGTGVPHWWAGSVQDYTARFFPIGAKVVTTGITSASCTPAAAARFAGRQSRAPLAMVIQTRDGLPLKSISANPGEDEVILAPGTTLRTVDVRHNNTGPLHATTVYLVAEDLVAEAQTHALGAARAARRKEPVS